MGKGDVSRLAILVDLHQLVEHGFTGLPELAQEAEMPRFGRQPFDEGFFAFSVLGLQGPDQYVNAVFKGFDPVFTRRFWERRRFMLTGSLGGRHGNVLCVE
ncbi:hypothetical protein D9M71_517000 [compost metagenome]